MAETQATELSERELEILRLVATGASNKEIAQQLFISANTVKVHLRNIFVKIGAASRTEAAMYAVSIGLVPGMAAETKSIESTLPDSDYPPGTNNATGATEVEATVATAPQSLSKTQHFPWPAIVLLALIMVAALGALIWQRSPDPNVPVGTDSPRWQTHADLPFSGAGLSLAPYEDQIITIGGETESGITGRVESYRPSTDTWTEKASKPTPVADASAVVIGGKIYVPGGRLTGGGLSQVLEIYDVRQDAWSRAASLPAPLSGYALAAYEGRLYLFGGWDGKNYLASVYEYDPAQDSWKAKTSMPSVRAFAGAAVAGGKIFVVGGTDGKRALRANEAYLPDLDNGQDHPWTTVKPLPEGRYAMGVAAVADIVIVVGGVGEKGSTPNSMEYFAQTDTWKTFGSLGEESWTYLGMVPLGSQLFLLGGRVDDALSARNLSYQVIYTLAIPMVR